MMNEYVHAVDSGPNGVRSVGTLVLRGKGGILSLNHHSSTEPAVPRSHPS